MANSFQLSLAPDRLWQSINPWNFYQQGAQFGLINIDLGQTAHPEIEKELLDEVGSYGRQIGRIGDAIEVLMRHVDRSKLEPEEKDVLLILEGQLAKVREVKKRARAEGK